MNEEHVVVLSFEDAKSAKEFMRNYNDEQAKSGNGFSVALYVKKYKGWFSLIDWFDVMNIWINRLLKGKE